MATDTTTPFVWGEGGAQLTPSQVAARREIASEMMRQGMDYSPVKSAWQGAARVAQSLLGTADSMSADAAEEKGKREAIAQALELFRGGQPGATSSPSAAPTGSVSVGPVAAAPAAPSSSPGKVDASGVVTVGPNDPSPLDPPVGADRDLMIRTVYGEAGNEPSEGQRAVAAVIRNRAADGNYGGTTIPGVVLAPNQFEPWNGGVAKQRMLALSPDDPKYKAIGDQVDAAYFGANDPTEGATHFFSPGGQAALGRKDPSWARGDYTEIGGHRFYSPDDEPAAKPVRLASAAAFAPADTSALPPGMPTGGLPEAAQPPSAPAPGIATVAQAMQPRTASAPAAPAPARPGVDAIARVMANPYLPAPLATALSAQLKPREEHVQETDAAGNIWDVNRLTGQRTVSLKKDATYSAPYRDEDGNLVQKDASGKISVVSAAEKSPASVQEYEYYKKNFQPTDVTQKPMSYDTWATAKARASAMTVNNNNNVGGGSDKQIFDSFDERSKEARATANGLVALRSARAALEGDGGTITGFRANERLALQKAGAYLGVTDPKSIQNTETFRAAIAPQVAAVLKSTVGTANISNSDREFAEKAAGGSITLDEGSIKRLLDIMERASVARLQLHQEQLDAVYPDPVANKRERALFGIKVPASDAPAPPAGATSSGIKWSVK